MIFSFIFLGFAQEPAWNVAHFSLAEEVDVYVLPVKKTGLISISIQYLLEGTEEEGMPHLIEHVLFEHRFIGQSYDQVLASMGGWSQAKTDMSSLRLYAHIPKEGWEQLLILEEHRMNYLCETITDDDIRNQSSIVLQEYMLDQQNPDKLYSSILRNAVFGTQSRGRSVIGDVEHVFEWDKKRLCQGYAQILNLPMRIVVVGDITTEEVLYDLHKHFSCSIRQRKKRIGSEPSIVELHDKGYAARLYAMWPIPLASDSDTQAINMWKHVLTHSKVGWLQTKEIRAQAWIEYGIEGGYFLISLHGAEPNVLKQHLKKMLRKGTWFFPSSIVHQAHKIQERAIYHGVQSISGRMMWLEQCIDRNALGSCFVFRENVSIEDMQHARKKWLSWEKASFLSVEAP